jgi:hypothetical protein
LALRWTNAFSLRPFWRVGQCLISCRRRKEIALCRYQNLVELLKSSNCLICTEWKMPIYRERYADDWDEIALGIKAAASWRCRHCNQQCLRPGEKPKQLSRSEWTVLTLSVHHANFTPEDNRPENLIPLCSPCHLALRCPGEAERIPHLGSWSWHCGRIKCWGVGCDVCDVLRLHLGFPLYETRLRVRL